MPQYHHSTITDIYWATNDGFQTGRDPMGIQNSSVATYNCLLPGITNLTGHIRYYSLYCWLLYKYDQRDKEKRIALHQYNFLRRAELVIAFIMKERNIRSVVGADFVQRRLYETIDGAYNIAAGADRGNTGNKNKYWSFPTGAFGQYYLGSLIYYGLVKMEENRFYLRDKGKEMARAFMESHDETDRTLFLDCILKGSISEDEINSLQFMALDCIATTSEEWHVLNDLLIREDVDKVTSKRSTLRRESIYLMLKYFNEKPTSDGFVHHRFLAYRPDDELQASFGWYFYYLCEALHYGIESILCLVLNMMFELHNPPIGLLIRETVNRVLNILKEEQRYNNLEEWMQDCNQTIDRQLDSVKKAIKERMYADAMAHSLRLFLCLYKEFRRNKANIMEFEQKHNLCIQRGIISEGLTTYVGRYLHFTIESYVETLLHQVMNEHTIVAVGKMGNSDKDLRKFILENGHTVLVEIRYPNTTTPRIESLRNFLVDLKYLTSDNQLTVIGRQYLEHYGKE